MDTAKSNFAPQRTPLASNKPNLIVGALVGLLLTVPLIAIFYLGDALLGLPFVPFDVLDWMTRNLPGGVISFGIETMVGIIRGLNLGETSSTAKMGEHAMAISGLLITGIVASAVYFFYKSQREQRDTSLTPGMIVGLIIGIPVTLISYTSNFTATADPIISVVWIVGVFLAWGAALAWIYNHLTTPAYVTSGSTTAEVNAIDRRSFLVRVGGAAATITVVGAGLGALLNGQKTPTIATGTTVIPEGSTTAANLPNASDPLVPAPGTRPEYTPVEDHYRIDISSRPPVIDEATWKMPIQGLVDNEMEFTLADIRAYETMDQFVTLACISNPLGGDLTSTTKWTGVSLQKVLADVKLQPDARFLRITSADGFDETLSLDMVNNDERIMLAYLWDDQPLPVRNGFPLRIYIPDHYGMKQPKWITSIEVVEEYEEGYWVRRGWDEVAQMRATSVIDTVAAYAIYEENGQKFVPVGGMAHAGARGISKVEIKVDDGDWVEADLRAPISDTTWTIWRYDWPFAEGSHTFAVRTYDGDGTPQIATPAPVHPSGATGIYSKIASL